MGVFCVFDLVVLVVLYLCFVVVLFAWRLGFSGIRGSVL